MNGGSRTLASKGATSTYILQMLGNSSKHSPPDPALFLQPSYWHAESRLNIISKHVLTLELAASKHQTLSMQLLDSIISAFMNAPQLDGRNVRVPVDLSVTSKEARARVHAKQNEGAYWATVPQLPATASSICQ